MSYGKLRDKDWRADRFPRKFVVGRTAYDKVLQHDDPMLTRYIVREQVPIGLIADRDNRPQAFEYCRRKRLFIIFREAGRHPQGRQGAWEGRALKNDPVGHFSKGACLQGRPGAWSMGKGAGRVP